YMAPEQAAGDPAVDSRADVYALGVTAYEMLTGHPPSPERAPHALLRAKLTTLPPPVDERRAEVSASLAALVQECLAPQPSDRPASAAAVVERLSVGASGAGHAAGRTLGWRVHTRRARRRLLLGAIAAVALVAAALGIAWRGRKAAGLASA